MASWPHPYRKNVRGVNTTWWTSRKPMNGCRLRTRVSNWGQERKEVGRAETRNMALLCLQRDFCLYLHVPIVLWLNDLKWQGLAPKDLRVSQLRTRKAALNSPYLRAHGHGPFLNTESPMASEYSPRQVTPCACFLTQNSFGQFLLLLRSLHLLCYRQVAG